MKSNSTDGLDSLRALARATDIKTCPPVPPPAKRTRCSLLFWRFLTGYSFFRWLPIDLPTAIGAILCSCASCCSLIDPLLAADSSAGVLRNIQEDAYAGEHHHDGRSSHRNERQRDSFRRQQA